MSRNIVIAAAVGASLITAGAAWAAEPIKIGTIAEESAISGVGIPDGAKIAADEINASAGVDGRKIEIVQYDDHNSAADAVRAFQRAANADHVNAVIASYISEVVLALEPWSGRLHLPMITPGAASNVITQRIKEDYDHLKYTFHGYLTSTELSDIVCNAAKDQLVGGLHMQSAVVVSEDAAWTIPLDEEYLKCLPQIGLKVLDHIRLSPDTTDFTPIWNKVEGEKPDVIITGISHVGVQPTVQWQQQQVPIPMYGISSQATSSTFWKDTNGASQGIVFNLQSSPDTPVTPVTVPFAKKYKERYGIDPGYAAYTSYDDVYIIAEAIKRAGGTGPDKLVTALEQTDHIGTIGREVFLGRDTDTPHGLRVGPGYITGLMVEWDNGKQVTVWPARVAQAKLTFPPFVKIKQTSAQ